jgi:hypothetical protein
MHKFTSLVILLMLTIVVSASNADSLFVTIEKHTLNKGDTLFLNCIYKYENASKSRVTLNVVIENIEKTKQWKFRYPLINGNVNPSIVIGNEIPEGNYAITFLIQNDFLSIKGIIKDYNAKTKGINYLLLTKDKDSYVGFLNPELGGYFTTPRMIFEDTARIIFSEMGKKYQSLYIDLKNYLDSAYKPIAQLTQFLTIGNIKKEKDSLLAENYTLDLNEKKHFTLNQVTVKSVLKKKVELFDEEYSSGLFKFGFPQIFDGIEGNQIGYSMDIFSFLQGRVAGLQVKRNSMGNYNIKWRDGNVDVYLDEFKVDNEMASYVNTNDIAMIKVFPPFSGGPSGNGSIAIYTKRGAYYSENSSRKYNFEVVGYNPEICTWH